MDSDSCKRTNKKEDQNDVSDLGDILQPSWVRCPICSCDEVDRILLDYGFNILCPIAIILWTVFLIEAFI